MHDELSGWLDSVILALVEARAVLASFGVSDRAIEERIEEALSLASALKWNVISP